LFVVEDVHAGVIFVCYIVICNNEVYATSGILDITVQDHPCDGLVLHEGCGITPLVGDSYQI